MSGDALRMPVQGFDVAKVTQEMASLVEALRPPTALRHQVDVLFRVEGQSVVMIERRAYWRSRDDYTEREFSQARFVKKTGGWSVHWKRANGRWERYEPCPSVLSLSEWVRLVDEDAHGCFMG